MLPATLLCLTATLGTIACQPAATTDEVLETEDLGDAPTASFAFDDDAKEQQSSDGAAGAVPEDFPSGLEMPSDAVVEGWGMQGENRWVSFRTPAGWQVEPWQDAHWQGRREERGGSAEPGVTAWRRGDLVIRTRWAEIEGQRLFQIVYPAR